jgi:protein-disulfide isomerase
VVAPATQPPVVAQDTPAAPATTELPAPDLTVRPGMTVKGKLASGADWGVTDEGHYFMGNPDALVMFTEFSDYQWPYCAKYVRETFTQIEENYIVTGKVVYIFKNFPLPNHAQAKIAAEAAECAGLQGKFWEVHTQVYLDQASWSGNANALDVLLGYGTQAKLDQTAYQKCLNDHTTLKHIEDDYNYGASIGVPATPAFLIAGPEGSGQVQPLTGAQPYSAFQQLFDQLLGVAPTTPATAP